jgi:hypothetical protein
MKVREDTGRVVALAAVFFGVLMVAGALAGVFERLGAELSLAVAMFGAAFAVATYWLDAGVRDWIGKTRAASFRRRVSRPSSLGPRASTTKAPAKSPGGKPAAT